MEQRACRSHVCVRSSPSSGLLLLWIELFLLCLSACILVPFLLSFVLATSPYFPCPSILPTVPRIPFYFPDSYSETPFILFSLPSPRLPSSPLPVGFSSVSLQLPLDLISVPSPFPAFCLQVSHLPLPSSIFLFYFLDPFPYWFLCPLLPDFTSALLPFFLCELHFLDLGSTA